PMGPFWLTGGGYGLDASWVTFFILLGTLAVVYRITRDLNFLHNAPVIVAGGISVDLDSSVQRQHGAYVVAAAPAPPSLVQIAPAAAPGASQEVGSIANAEQDNSRS